MVSAQSMLTCVVVALVVMGPVVTVLESNLTSYLDAKDSLPTEWLKVTPATVL